jgi:hypothetical protein
MKTLNKLFATGAMVFLLMLMAPHKSMAQDDGYVSDQEFYDELQQYGTWVQDDQYGDVWVPDVDGDFRPYATNGYWIQTDYGTTWVSDYPWGWATFHYGRWRYDDYYGWEWIPGHQWAPAWVSWRQGGGYYGWAPMGPGISLTLSLGGIGLNINDNYWVYAPQRYITSRYINRYYAPRTQISVIIRRTTYIHNTYVYNKRTYITGPRPADIQRITRRKVTVYKINNAPRPGAFHEGGNAINIYRPAIRKAPDARPVRVVSATAYKNEHPTEGIGKKGAVGYNHGNAGKLATIARSNNPDGKIVRVNPKRGEPNGPNKPSNAAENNPAVPAGGHKTTEPKGNKGNHKNAPVAQPEQGGGQQAQPTGNKPAEPQGNAPAQPAGARGHHKTAPATTQPVQGQEAQPQPQVNKPAEPQSNTPAQPAAGRGHHKTAPATTQPVQGQEAQPQPQVNKPAEPQNNTPAQPGQASNPGRHQHKQAPAVMPPAQTNTDQAKKEEQQQQQQAAQQQKQQQQQAQQATRQQAAQQQKQQQQQAQQAARQQAAQQQKQQQQQAQQAARQQAQQQAQQQKKQQEEQQKQQQQNPPRN